MLPEDLGKILVSMVLGGALGLERELSDKPAGLKTNLLICLGSTLFTIFSIRLAGAAYDPGRIAAQIVTGVGFLGAGAILREGTHVIGLTTAAMIWLGASVGMGVGCGYYTLSGYATVAALMVQFLIPQLEYFFMHLREDQYTLRITTKPQTEMLEEIEEMIRHSRVKILGHKVSRQADALQSEWQVSGKKTACQSLFRKLISSEKILEVTY